MGGLRVYIRSFGRPTHQSPSTDQIQTLRTHHFDWSCSAKDGGRSAVRSWYLVSGARFLVPPRHPDWDCHLHGLEGPLWHHPWTGQYTSPISRVCGTVRVPLCRSLAGAGKPRASPRLQGVIKIPWGRGLRIDLEAAEKRFPGIPAAIALMVFIMFLSKNIKEPLCCYRYV